MAEITSAIPTSGGPYFWAAMLSPPKYAPFLSWITGWANFVGQFAVSCGIIFGLAGLISTAASVLGDYEPSPGKTMGIHAALLFAMGMINTFGVKILGYLNNISIILHSIGVASFAIAILAKAPTHQSAKFVFTKFNDATGDPSWSERASPAYVAICGILISQYTITGFDASAHLSEETRNADRSAPIGVLTSVGVSAVFGFFLMISLLFSIQDFEATVSAPQPVLQILLDVFGHRGATALVVIPWFM
jgi:amino acid transporter